MQMLGDLQAKEKALQEVPQVTRRATAACKWTSACKVAEESRSVELWCCGVEHLNGFYVYRPPQSGPPTYQHQTYPHKWLFVAVTGGWWIGEAECKDKRHAKGWMHCEAVEPGTLPQDVIEWQAPKSSEWELLEHARFWLSESVDVAWQNARIACFQSPVIQIRGVTDSIVDGLFDFVPGDDEVGQPPSFQHQQRPNLWLFLARDQRWWVGNGKAKEDKDDRGLMHSGSVSPGMIPTEAVGWHVRNGKTWEECRALKISKVPGAKRASEKWADANRRAKGIQIWGKEYYQGEYFLEGCVDGLPAYQYSVDADVWLYLAMDGCWWLSDTENKDARRARGFLKSDLIEPGTLPQDIESWRDRKVNSWEANPMVRVLVAEDAAKEWQVAWQFAEKADVIEIEHVTGPEYNGLYDLVLGPGNSKGQPPTYQHQRNQDQFLYVARDGRWWVSNTDCMNKREPSGRMHSDLIRPGVLPFNNDNLRWHVFNRTSKEWERQEDVAIVS
uniref:Uncharacterized protein n=1 Tax=Alexandrium catenella TaxID=2925 RepID=A0A7S1RIW4_ALECA